MPRDLPARASVEHLKKQAKELLRDFEQLSPDAIERFRPMQLRDAGAPPKLADAQHIVAREYGFDNWAALKHHVDARAQTRDPIAELVDAFHANDSEVVDDLLTRHPAIRSRLNASIPGSAFGATPLMEVAQRQQRAMVDVLVRHGADINARSVWWAGSFGVLDSCAPDFAPFLIERGATVDVHAAARLGMMDTLDHLVSTDPALVHARGGDGQTPLHFAATVEVARYLLNHGADIDARDVDHESTPAQYMVRDRQDVARFLVTRGCATDILLAAALGAHELVRRHLDAEPASIEMRVSERFFPMRDTRAGGVIYTWTLGANKTPHVVAREFGHEDVFRLLMERSSVELQLAQAFDLGDEALCNALLAEHPGLAKAMSRNERRKIVDAAGNNNAAAVKLMLAAGWPLDARGDLGATALHFAAWMGNTEIVRDLLKHGAPVEVRGDHYDMTPLGWAMHGSENSWRKDEGDYAGVVAQLLDAGAHIPVAAGEHRASGAVREVLQRRAERQP